MHRPLDGFHRFTEIIGHKLRAGLRLVLLGLPRPRGWPRKRAYSNQQASPRRGLNSGPGYGLLHSCRLRQVAPCCTLPTPNAAAVKFLWRRRLLPRSPAGGIVRTKPL